MVRCTYTLPRLSTPSKNVNNWLTTLSVTPVLSLPLFGAAASNSSKNKIQGDAALARANKSRTPYTNNRQLKLQNYHNYSLHTHTCSLCPIYLLSISGPFTDIKFSPQAPAIALASKVFPHPGGPYSSTPRARGIGEESNS